MLKNFFRQIGKLIFPNTESTSPWQGQFHKLDILSVVISRATLFGILFWVAISFDHENILRTLLFVYGLSTVLYLSVWIWSYRTKRSSPIGVLLYFQFFIELSVETTIFFSGGGFTSDYGLLFLLTILSAGLFFQFWGSLIIATLAVGLLGYSGLLHLGLANPLGIYLPSLSVETVQVRFFLYTSLFYLSALLSSHLSARLMAATKELAGTHEALDLYQFSAENMMSNLPNGLIFFDAANLLKYTNNRSEELLGLKLIAGMSIQEVFSGIPFPSEIIDSVEKEKSDFPFTEVEIWLSEDRPLHVQLKALVRKEKFLGMIITLMDFTQEKQMEKALLKSARMAAIGEMSAKMAHEIRNPLASISGSAQMLEDSTGLAGSDAKLLSLIITQSQRLDRTLTGLLNYAKDKTPSYRKVSALALFREVESVLEKNPSFNKDLVSITQFIENGDIEFTSDKDLIFQVLLNIALNGLQALLEGNGVLEFSAKHYEKGICFQLRDNGIGLTPLELSRAFEPFFTTKSFGTGLGLATCFHYVQKLDGNINLNSTKGIGTVVTVTLPKNISKMGIVQNGYQA